MGPLVTITVMYKSYIIVLYNNNPLQGLNVLTYILTYQFNHYIITHYEYYNTMYIMVYVYGYQQVINVVPLTGNLGGDIIWESECLSEGNVVDRTLIPERE